MLSLLKRLIPSWAMDQYHRLLSWVAAVKYGHPSKQMVVIGVTGTNGKTTTSYLIAKALEASGEKTGCTTTALFKVADREWLNTKKMTMLGRFALQKTLREMVDAGCRYAVVETSSQGVLQHRHENIAYDVAVFTNLTPEHVEAHGGFENYKQAKLTFFRYAASLPRKILNGKTVPRLAIVNRDRDFSTDFAKTGFRDVVWYGARTCMEGDVCAKNIEEKNWTSTFTVDDVPAVVHMPGMVNVENAMAAVAVAVSLGMPREAVLKKLSEVSGVPGRFERIDEGQSFSVIVDYAPEPASLERVYEAISKIPHTRLIHVLGSAGGGRDVWRRKVLGEMAARKAAEVIVTNEDPYDEDPQKIIRQVSDGARAVGRAGVQVFEMNDRREAIQRAMRDARPGDLVLLTGKGCEQAIMGPNGTKIPWDEREVARDAIRAILSPASSF
jgi:UDP-N-acetylmuramoyl-L-alanyl-D-glutamate--2,6-diaminopimelate ligase